MTGPATAIRAIAAGKVAAANIDSYLGYDHTISTDVEIPAPKTKDYFPCGRINVRERDPRRKRDFEEVGCSLTQGGDPPGISQNACGASLWVRHSERGQGDQMVTITINGKKDAGGRGTTIL